MIIGFMFGVGGQPNYLIYGGPYVPPAASFLLMESGSYFLLEDGVSRIQLEV